MGEITINITIILAVIGVLAFFVSVITELLKNIWPFKAVPTDAFVLILSIGLAVTAFVAYMQYVQQEILWYMILAAVMAGLIVAFVAMYGWEKLSELWKRFSRGGIENK